MAQDMKLGETPEELLPPSASRLTPDAPRPWPWWPSPLNEKIRREAEAVEYAKEVGHPEEFGQLDLSHGVGPLPR
jgi:hypothetical protein